MNHYSGDTNLLIKLIFYISDHNGQAKVTEVQGRLPKFLSFHGNKKPLNQWAPSVVYHHIFIVIVFVKIKKQPNLNFLSVFILQVFLLFYILFTFYF